MKLTTEKGEFHAHFWHHSIEQRHHRRPHLVTEVRLHPGKCLLDANKHCTLPATHAVATCHSRLDAFDKKVGRVIALDRALRGVTGEFLPRALRAQLWDSYKTQAHLPKSRGSR